jgi:hypothetical protein
MYINREEIKIGFERLTKLKRLSGSVDSRYFVYLPVMRFELPVIQISLKSTNIMYNFQKGGWQ